MTQKIKTSHTIDEDGNYRGYHIYYDPPPIPIRTCDYHFHHKDIDLDDPRHGHGSSEEDCMEQIDEQIADSEEE